MENKIAEDIYWVGLYFPDIQASVNSFLVRDEKTALIDAGAPATAQGIISNIKTLIDPREIDYIVLTHNDLDHAGGLKDILSVAPQAQVVASELEGRMIGMWGLTVQPKIVKDGERLTLGKHTLRFVATPYVETPGAMVAFEEKEGILFSADLLGAAIPQWTLFAHDNLTEPLRQYQAWKLDNSSRAQEALLKVKDLPINIVAPSHGLMIKEGIKNYIETLAR